MTKEALGPHSSDSPPISVERAPYDRATDGEFSYSCAWDIFYIKSAGKWTLEKETRLIAAYRSGNPPGDLSRF